MTCPTCATCQHWKLSDSYQHELVFPPDPVTYEEPETEDEVVARFGYRVRYCKHPKIVFYERPERNAAAVVDGSKYHGEFLTAEGFGCLLHSPTAEK